MVPFSGAASALIELSNTLAETIAQAGRSVVTLYGRSRWTASIHQNN